MNEMKLLTVKEASAATRLSKSKIYELVYSGVLHRVRLPHCNKVLLAESELIRYIREGVAAGSQEATRCPSLAEG